MSRDDVASLHCFAMLPGSYLDPGCLLTDQGARDGLAWLWFFARHGLGSVSAVLPPN